MQPHGHPRLHGKVIDLVKPGKIFATLIGAIIRGNRGASDLCHGSAGRKHAQTSEQITSTQACVGGHNLSLPLNTRAPQVASHNPRRAYCRKHPDQTANCTSPALRGREEPFALFGCQRARDDLSGLVDRLLPRRQHAPQTRCVIREGGDIRPLDFVVTVSLVSEPAHSPHPAPEAAAERSARPRRLGNRELHRVTRYTCSAIYTRADGE